jgi:proteic killer suppression protein
MDWKILEHDRVDKHLRKVPEIVIKKYEVWKNLIFHHGPEILRKFPGFHDESLSGDRFGQRSSRLNLKYRVIYKAAQNEKTVWVIEITPHKY